MKVSCGRIISFVLAGMMLSGVGALAYSATFSPPQRGSGKVLGSQLADGQFTPYVNQDVYSVPTLYFLSTSAIYSSDSSKMVTTGYAQFSTPGIQYLTYKTGYGGYSQRYYLQACPAVSEFNTYTVTGTWKP